MSRFSVDRERQYSSEVKGSNREWGGRFLKKRMRKINKIKKDEPKTRNRSRTNTRQERVVDVLVLLVLLWSVLLFWWPTLEDLTKKPWDRLQNTRRRWAERGVEQEKDSDRQEYCCRKRSSKTCKSVGAGDPENLGVEEERWEWVKKKRKKKRRWRGWKEKEDEKREEEEEWRKKNKTRRKTATNNIHVPGHLFMLFCVEGEVIAACLIGNLISKLERGRGSKWSFAPRLA